MPRPHAPLFVVATALLALAVIAPASAEGTYPESGKVWEDGASKLSVAVYHAIKLDLLLDQLPDTSMTARSDEHEEVQALFDDGVLAELIHNERCIEIVQEAKGSDVAIESLELAYEGLNWEAPLEKHLEGVAELGDLVEALDKVIQKDPRVSKPDGRKYKMLIAPLILADAQASLWLRTSQQQTSGGM